MTKEGQEQKQIPYGNDKQEKQYRGLSTSAANYAASGRDDASVVRHRLGSEGGLVGPAGDRGDEHDLIAVLELVGVAAEEADVFIVDVDVDEAAELAVLILDVLRERGELGVELGEQAGEVGGLGLKRLLSIGVAGQRGG